MKCYEQGLDFRTELMKDQGIGQYLSDAEIENITTNEHYFRYIDTIFTKVFGKDS
jgi:adenylosuccinate lyase